jgi:hypothetical protein
MIHEFMTTSLSLETESSSLFHHNVAFLWMDKNTSSESEAACVTTIDGMSKCTTRILEVDDNDDAENEVSIPNTSRSVGKSHHDDDVAPRSNILVVLLDPISRSHFHRVMPQSVATLHEEDFIEFERYTAVGPNSGPNQAALYSGIPLSNRDGINHDLTGDNVWLWDRLRANGYTTLKAEDGCIENSNMIKSLKPNTTHGDALSGVFCYDAFARPNCIGPDRTSTLLFNYGEQFITVYEERRKRKLKTQRQRAKAKSSSSNNNDDNTNRHYSWASFLHFIDSHEDTMVLAALVDDGLSQFIRNVQSQGYLDNTVLVVTSDHGLHYGPFYQSKQGRREATEPILYIRIPVAMKDFIDMNVLEQNSHLWTTPFDVHETLLALTQTSIGLDSPTSASPSVSRRRGSSLTRPLPKSRERCIDVHDLIPSKYCVLQNDNDDGLDPLGIQTAYSRPMINSFFLDIPRENRPKLKLDDDCTDVITTTWQASEPCTDQSTSSRS